MLLELRRWGWTVCFIQRNLMKKITTVVIIISLLLLCVIGGCSGTTVDPNITECLEKLALELQELREGEAEWEKGTAAKAEREREAANKTERKQQSVPTAPDTAFVSDFESIWLAAAEGDVEDVEYFIQKGADVNAVMSVGSHSGITLLHVTAITNNADVAALLISKGANVDARTPVENATPLHIAELMGNTAVAELLISKGANVNIRTIVGDTSRDLRNRPIPTNEELAEAGMKSNAVRKREVAAREEREQQREVQPPPPILLTSDQHRIFERIQWLRTEIGQSQTMINTVDDTDPRRCEDVIRNDNSILEFYGAEIEQRKNEIERLDEPVILYGQEVFLSDLPYSFAWMNEGEIKEWVHAPEQERPRIIMAQTKRRNEEHERNRRAAIEAQRAEAQARVTREREAREAEAKAREEWERSPEGRREKFIRAYNGIRLWDVAGESRGDFSGNIYGNRWSTDGEIINRLRHIADDVKVVSDIQTATSHSQTIRWKLGNMSIEVDFGNGRAIRKSKIGF